MKNQALFSSKDKSKILKCCQLHFLFGCLWVKPMIYPNELSENPHTGSTGILRANTHFPVLLYETLHQHLVSI